MLASGVHPATDFEGKPLHGARAKRAGKPLAGVRNQKKYVWLTTPDLANYRLETPHFFKIPHITFAPQSASSFLGAMLHHALSSGGVAYCVEYRGDWKWQREAFGLRSHWGATDFCHHCVAKGNGLWNRYPVILKYPFV